MHSDLVTSFRDLAIVAAALVAGGQIFVLFVVARTMRALPTLDSLRLHQRMLSTDYPDAYIQPAGIMVAVLGAVLLGLERSTVANDVFTAIPIAAIATIVVLTRTINRPINRRLATWTEADLPAYPAVRRRWDVGHAFRTLCGTTALVSYILLAAR